MMTSKAEKDHIKRMIAVINKAASGDDSIALDVSPANDEMDLLASAINQLLKKAGKPVPTENRDNAGQDVTDERYRNILESMQEAYFETDLKGNMLFYNDRVTGVLGYSPEEISDMTFKQLVNEANAKKLYETFSTVYRTREAIRGFEWQVIKKNGEIIDVESSIALLRHKNGKPRGFLGVVRNITKRKQAETKLRQNEEYYRNILNSIEESYLELDLKGNLRFFNQAVMNELGYTSEELAGMNYQRIVGKENEKMVYEKFHKVFLTGEPVKDFAWQVIKKDGSSIDVESSIALLRDENGKPCGFRSVERDITRRRQIEEDLKRSEERYRTILDIMGEAYLEHDLKGNIIFANDTACKLLGLGREKLIGMNYRNYLTPEAAKNISDIFQRVYKTGQPALLIDYDVLHEDGTTNTYEMNVALVQDQSGTPCGFRVLTWDVTERKKTELDLRESEKRYRIIVENMQDSISLLDLDLNYIYQSPSEIRITGFTPEELMKIPLQNQMTQESYQLVEKIMAEELALEFSGEPLDLHRSRTVELESYHKNGGTIWEEITAAFNRDENGKPIGILISSREITKRREIQEALKESEKRYRLIAENVNDIVWTIGLDLKFIYASPSHFRVTGFTPEQTGKMSFPDFITPESFALITRVLSEELSIETSGQSADPNRSRTLELEIYAKPREHIWMEVNATFNRDATGKANAILAVGRDITRRKKIEQALLESEKRYRMIVENMSDIIWVMDLDFRYKYRSPSNIQITGHTPEEIKTIPARNHITPESYALAEKVLAEELKLEFSGEPVDPHRSRTLEVEVYHKNGGTIWLEISATFGRDENGKPSELIIAGRNVTERKKMQAEKETLEKQLIQAQKMETVGRLAGGVAHDFNNMLSVILGYVDLAKLRLYKGSPVLNDIAEIEKAAIRSRDITSQLLAFSRKQIIAPKNINLNKMIAHTQKTLARLIGEDIDLKVHPEDGVWIIRFDPSQIEQILMNLAVNARDAMPHGGKLTIETANVRLNDAYCREHLGFHPGYYVCLTISDNGTGIDKETLPYIFEPFFTTKETGKGTGLGLATVYGIVQQNGGFINVYSEPGQGTSFKIYLPRSVEELDIKPAAEDEPLVMGSGNIVLVEDDALVLRMTTDMLRSIGYSVTAVANPLEALHLCGKGDMDIDLVMTDVVMPVMSGRELRDRLSIIRPDIKVLFMSGYTSNVIVHHGVLEQGVHFLQKPFSIKGLATMISEIMLIK
jgi:two-component system, cell cycle sensor histidine kinase and response regulator CckA